MTHYAVMAPNHDRAEVFDHLDDAVDYLDSLKDDTFRVFTMQELSESALWDWTTRLVGSNEEPSAVYTSERVARICRPADHELIKRRCGTSQWVPGGAA